MPRSSRTGPAPPWPMPWLEIVLILYAVILVRIYHRPDSFQLAMADEWIERLVVGAMWIIGGTLGAVLALSGLFLAFYLLYSPFYLLGNLRRALDPTVWLDPRELRFYLYCFGVLCALIGLAVWNLELAVAGFVILAGSARLLWHLLV